jgi:hypothetical protein
MATKKVASSDVLWSVGYNVNGYRADEDLLILGGTIESITRKAKRVALRKHGRKSRIRITELKREGTIDAF